MQNCPITTNILLPLLCSHTHSPPRHPKYHPWTLATTKWLSISIIVSFQDLYKKELCNMWPLEIGFLFAQINAPEVHTHCVYQKPILFYCWVVWYGWYSFFSHTPFVDTLVSRLGLLQIKLLWTMMYRFLCTCNFSFLWDKDSGVQFLGHMLRIGLVF